MKPEQYLENASRTESVLDIETFQERFKDEKMIRLLHAGMGVVTESGELMDAIKKWVFYGKKIDVVNVKEEVGDLLWYVAVVCNAFDWTLEELFDQNIDKLKARFGEKFSEEKAINRDLDAERKLLEDSTAVDTSESC